METSTQQIPETSRALDPAIQKSRFFAAIGYLSFLCFVPLFLKRDNKFAQFHGRQGLILFILEFALGILIVVPVVGEVIFRFACLLFWIFSLTGIVKVFMNQYWQMPVIYPIASKVTF